MRYMYLFMQALNWRHLSSATTIIPILSKMRIERKSESKQKVSTEIIWLEHKRKFAFSRGSILATTMSFAMAFFTEFLFLFLFEIFVFQFFSIKNENKCNQGIRRSYHTVRGCDNIFSSSFFRSMFERYELCWMWFIDIFVYMFLFWFLVAIFLLWQY